MMMCSVALLLLAVAAFCPQTYGQAQQQNATSTYTTVVRNGRTIFISEELLQELDEEERIWHWKPYLKTRTKEVDNVVEKVGCIGGNSIESFPDSIFNDTQLRSGGFLLYLLFGIYSFTLLASVCNYYFIPCVEIICETLDIPQNVAAATFMAVATSCPEFFVNVISTFLTESDMGIGTIVGSAIFNALGVAAIGGIAAIKPILIESRPVTRDVLIYMFNVTVLVVIVWDGQVMWYEALVLGVLYVLYFVLMFNSIKLFGVIDRLIERMCKSNTLGVDTENGKSTQDGEDNLGFDSKDPPATQIVVNGLNSDKVTVVDKVESEPETKNEDEPMEIWTFPKDTSVLNKIWWLYTWVVRFALSMTIPSPITCKKWFPVTFIMCIVWIGVNSYFVSWTMTVIGHTFFIPESVMGMTFLAFGGCLPEACAIFIMSRRGEGGMGVSNALGANSLAILFALGLPWLIRTLTLLVEGAEVASVNINSAGIDFIVGSLLVAVGSLWITLLIGKFTLRSTIGAILACLYIVFVTFAILVETGVIVDREIPFC